MGQLNKRKKLLMLISVVALLTLVIGVTAYADLSGPNFSNQTPAIGATVNVANPQIKVHVTDQDGINDGSLKFYINNQLKSATITHPVTWIEDPITWEYIQAPDPNQADITCQASGLPDGSNTVKIELKDNQGNPKVYEWSFNVVVAPTASGFTPANGATVTSSKPTISAVIQDSNGNINPGSIVLKIGSTQVDHSFDSATGTVSYTPVDALASGTHNVSLNATDMGGNPVSAAWSFTVDAGNNGPVFSELDPAEGAALTVANKLIKVHAADTDKINDASLKFYLDGNLKTATITHPTTMQEDPVTYQMVQVTDETNADISFQANDLGDSTHTIKVELADKLGAAVTKEWSFTVNIAPTASNLTPADGSTITETKPEISATLSDSNGQIDPESIVLKQGTQTVAHQFDSATGKVSYIPATPLASGNYTFTLTAADMGGNPVNASWTFTVVSANAGPSFSAEAPSNGAALTIVNPLIKVQAADADGINDASLKMWVDGQEKTAIITHPTVMKEDPVTYQIVEVADETKAEISFQTTKLVDGSHHVKVQLADKLGETATKEWDFTVTVAPTITNRTPANGSTINENRPTISAILADANGTIDASTVVMKLGTTTVNRNFDIATGIVSHTPATALAAGDYTVTVEAKDNSGNPVSATWSFTVAVQNVGPAFTELDPADGATLMVSNYLIKIKAADANELDKTTLVVKLDGNTVPAAIQFPIKWIEDENYNQVQAEDLTQGTISYQANGMDFGPHSLEITIKDKMGASSTSSTSFFVDQSAVKPVISNLAPVAGLVKTLRPAISADITATSAISREGIRLLVDGENITTFVFTSTGTNSGNVTYTPPADLANESMHYITLTVTDARSISATEQWSFYTTAFPEMAGILNPKECLVCHNLKIHPVNQCASCHEGGGDACLSCHSEHGPDVITTYRNNDCFTCHGPNGYIANWCQGHDVDVAHTLPSSCAGECHANSLTREHQNRTDDLGNAYNCSTCHSNTNAAIVSALITPSKSCDSCHDRAHNINFVEKVPVDIPLHSSFMWSAPQKASIWKGESWLPLDYADAGGKLVISNRHDTSIMDTTQALNYYKTEMVNKGWTLASEEPSTAYYFYLTFTKVNRVCTIIWYTDQTHTGTNPLPAGGRFEILYK